ncbi:MAG: hypothetical protein KGI29_03780 [Pseudomonadota bacterium]|nr:hypothetical protein [Pseudomonadota bacterium]MDE3038586.1 hypothetical protein [Pseudomonadota bacterium]
MNTSVGTKARKKQPALSAAEAAPADDRRLEISLLSLENACLRIFDARPARRDDIDLLTWQQRLKNTASLVSLALAESKGPRHFHYHYRHNKNDDSVLHPVLGNPLDMLAQVCRDALRQCRTDLVGIQDSSLNRARNMFEAALQGFLTRYSQVK